MGVKLKHFRNILTFWNVDATQLRHRGALRDLGHPSEVQGAQAQGRESGCIILATPDKHSSIEAKIRRSPSISTMELLSFPIIARVLVRRTSKMIMLADQHENAILAAAYDIQKLPRERRPPLEESQVLEVWNKPS